MGLLAERYRIEYLHIHCRVTSYTWTISMFSGASHEEIRSSYKRLALRWHPDKHNNSQEATKVNCQELCITGNRSDTCAAYLSIHSCSILCRSEVWNLTKSCLDPRREISCMQVITNLNLPAINKNYCMGLYCSKVG